MHLRLRMIGLLALLGGALAPGALRAEAVTKPGQLVVVDKGNLFSDDGVRRAKEEFARLQSKTGRQVMIETFRELPAADAARYAKIDQKDASAVRRFWRDLGLSMAKTDQAHGVYILVCRKPGYVEVIADQEVRGKGFDEGKERRLAADLLKAMRDAAKEKSEADRAAAHDRALMSAVEYLETHLPGASADAKQPSKPHAEARDRQPAAENEGWGIGGWICLGVAVLLGVWLMFAIFRAFSGGGGMGGGGGFGGGGFFPGLLGGMFGAVAGMWMYDQFFGGHSAHGGDYGSGGSSANAGAADDAGAGDFSGDAGAGGSFDDAGGGDFGGGDGGGGGDFGGGGGDF